MRATPQSHVPPTVLSGVLIACSALWFVAAWIFYLTNRTSKDGVFGALLWALLLLVLVPLSVFVLAPCLVKARRSDHQCLRALDYCELLAGIASFAFVGVLLLVYYFR
jgi:hypothetical protein